MLIKWFLWALGVSSLLGYHFWATETFKLIFKKKKSKEEYSIATALIWSLKGEHWPQESQNVPALVGKYNWGTQLAGVKCDGVHDVWGTFVMNPFGFHRCLSLMWWCPTACYCQQPPLRSQSGTHLQSSQLRGLASIQVCQHTLGLLFMMLI